MRRLVAQAFSRPKCSVVRNVASWSRSNRFNIGVVPTDAAIRCHQGSLISKLCMSALVYCRFVEVW